MRRPGRREHARYNRRWRTRCCVCRYSSWHLPLWFLPRSWRSRNRGGPCRHRRVRGASMMCCWPSRRARSWIYCPSLYTHLERRYPPGRYSRDSFCIRCRLHRGARTATTGRRRLHSVRQIRRDATSSPWSIRRCRGRLACCSECHGNSACQYRR